MSTKPAASSRPLVIRIPTGGINTGLDLTRLLPAWIVSAVMHVVIVLLFLFLGLFDTRSEGSPVIRSTNVETVVDDNQNDSTLDLTNDDLGNDPEVPLAYKNIDKIDDVSIPGTPVPDEPTGIAGAPDGPKKSVPPPPGPVTGDVLGGFGTGNGPAIAMVEGAPGGMMGKFVAGGFNGRSAATKELAVKDGGGSAKSEEAVASGLRWLATHQSDDGSWSMDRFHTNAREKPGLGGKKFVCNCAGQGMHNDTAGTAFGVLPFLAAGVTHKNTNQMKIDYTKSVEAALRHLIQQQDAKTGDLGGGMYAHGLATIALCEAYGLSADQTLKAAAQKAIDFIVSAQDPASGGWRYSPRTGGDTSVVGWQLMAIKSGQMAGLKVPNPTLAGAEKWLDSCEAGKAGSSDYGYGYVGKAATPTMTSVGLLCRQYLGWSPKKPELITGVNNLITHAPATNGAINSMYFNYYATQVMHHMGGSAWNTWNPRMRDHLIEAQDKGRSPKRPHQSGSFGPEGDVFGGSGGRIMQTSLSLLTLEVYYRHLPLYSRNVVTGKDGDKENK